MDQKSHSGGCFSPLKRYRCFTHPIDGDGFPLPVESGVLQSYQVKASSAEDAARKVAHVSGRPVSSVERLEVAA